MNIPFDREQIIRGLKILYPPDHAIIELGVPKKDEDGFPTGHFEYNDFDLLMEEIEKYDARNNTLAIFTGLNKIKPESFTRKDKPLKLGKVRSGGRAGGKDIERIRSILIDIDPFRANGDEKDSTSEDEHQAGLDAAKGLKERLSSMGWPEPVFGDSGNGAQLRYATDLAATKESTKTIKKALVAANALLPEDLKTKAKVDTTTHDLPRVAKVFGTMTRKGPGTEERPWRRSRIISAPEKLEPVSLDSIKELIDNGKAEGEAETTQLGDQTKPLSDVESDIKIRPCLKEIILKKEIKKLEEFAAHEHKGRAAIATELMFAGYSDAALHEFFSRLSDYVESNTAYQLNSILTYIETGGKPWKCQTLIEEEVIPEKRCESCRWAVTGSLARSEWEKGFFVHTSGRTMKGIETKDGEKTAAWVADGYAYIDSILEAYNTNSIARYFVIKGRGVGAKDEFKITVKATDASEDRKLTAALVNEFGRDPIGDLDLLVIQRLSAKRDIQFIRVFNRPIWLNDKLIAPGLTAGAIEFNFERKVAIDFRTAGDLEEGKKAFENVLNGFDEKNVVLLAASVIGAPIIAKLWHDDRFALFIQATTGEMKTTAVMLLMCIYGPRYAIEATLVRWGDGATSNATEHIAAKTGPFPFPLDNYKTYTDQDPGRLQRAIHAILEGTEKDRLNKESELRQGDEYLCTPIITGENYPGNDSATRARIVQIEWTGPINLSSITEAQKHTKDLNAFGKAFLLWLNSPDGQRAMNDQAGRFDQVRIHYLKTVSGAINAGRIATNAAVIMLSWEVFAKWPVAEDIARKYAPALEAAINEHVLRAQVEVGENLDAEKFVSWLRAEVYVGKYSILGDPDNTLRYNGLSEVIGEFRDYKQTKEPKALLLLPDIFSSKLLPAWQKATNGTKADKKSLIMQLVDIEYIIYNNKESKNTHVKTYDGRKKRVYVFPWDKMFPSDPRGYEGNPATGTKKTRSSGSGNPVTRGNPLEREKVLGRKFYRDENELSDPQKQLDKYTGTYGLPGYLPSTVLDHRVTHRVTRREPLAPSISFFKADVVTSSYDDGPRTGKIDRPTPESKKKPNPDGLKHVRILKDYRTQDPRPGVPGAYDEVNYRIGETREIAAWRIKELVARGIVEVADSCGG